MQTTFKLTALLGALATVLAPSLHAQTSTWNGGGGNVSWTTGANWGGTAPSAGNALVFGGPARLANTNDYTAPTSFNGITFDNTSGAFVLGGNQVRLTGAITNNDADTQTINLLIDLNGSALSVSTASGNIALGGVISGAGGLTRTAVTNNTTLTLNSKDLTISGIDSKINLDITGLGDGAFDRIVGIATFAQGGDITFTLSGSYVDGNSWNVFGFSGKSGTFSSVALAGDYIGPVQKDGILKSFRKSPEKHHNI
jgi:hypothetical protein